MRTLDEMRALVESQRGTLDCTVGQLVRDLDTLARALELACEPQDELITLDEHRTPDSLIAQASTELRGEKCDWCGGKGELWRYPPEGRHAASHHVGDRHYDRKPTASATYVICPHCHGTGLVCPVRGAQGASDD